MYILRERTERDGERRRDRETERYLKKRNELLEF